MITLCTYQIIQYLHQLYPSDLGYQPLNNQLLNTSHTNIPTITQN